MPPVPAITPLPPPPAPVPIPLETPPEGLRNLEETIVESDGSSTPQQAEQSTAVDVPRDLRGWVVSGRSIRKAG